MARKKTTTDDPTFAMVLERGHLVPAFPDDAERLASWREGSKFWVTFSQREQRPLIVKWKALINDAIKGGNTPWTNAPAADDAIKLALGMIEVDKGGVTKDGKATGQWIHHPRSTNDFDDRQLEELIEMEVALLYRLTGVDYEQAYRDRVAARQFTPDYPALESSDNNPPAPLPVAASDEGHGDPQASTPLIDGLAVADQSNASGSHASTGDTDDSGGAVSCDPAATNSATDDNASTTALEGDAGTGVAASGAGGVKSAASPKIKPHAKGELSGAEAVWLLEFARAMVGATEPDCGGKYDHLLKAAVQDALDRVPPGGIGEKAKQLANQVRTRCIAIADGKEKMDLRFIATVVGCAVTDLKEPTR